MPQLIQSLSQIDYPKARLEGFLLLEDGDDATHEALKKLRLPLWLKVVTVPHGSPRTKPRALNYGLQMATGELLTIYDAEDRPAPQQLKEAAYRFMKSDKRLACLQAPLRILRQHNPSVASPIIDRQFAAEYAALFEVFLPAMVRLGLPFPLGGTSNHFRVDALRSVGGWDAYNVTEDADLGFRLWRSGYTLGVINAPTFETPPGPLKLWLPQRTRWLKGYLQTAATHFWARDLGWRGRVAMLTTILAGLVAASLHGFALAGVVALLLLRIINGQMPEIDTTAIAVLAAGCLSSWLACAKGMQRAGNRYTLVDMAIAPFYWALLTFAFLHALVRLVFTPYAWDKTPHQPDVPLEDLHSSHSTVRYSSADAGRKAA